MEQALDGAHGLMAPAMLPGPVIEGPPYIPDSFAIGSRPQVTGKVIESRRQGQQVIPFPAGLYLGLLADDVGYIAFIPELMDPRRFFHGTAVIVSDDVGYDEPFRSPGRP